MTLRTKTLLATSLTLLCLVATLYATSATILTRGFARVEDQDMRQNVRRVTEALDDEITKLSFTSTDWASWDDSYAFIETNDQTFRDTNLNPETLARINLNMMTYVRNDGQIIFGTAIDPANVALKPLSTSMTAIVQPDSLLIKQGGTAGIKGVMLLPEGPMLVSARPVLHGNGDGPVRGTLVMGRFLNEATIQTLASRTHVDLAILRLDQSNLAPDLKAIQATLGTNQTPAIKRTSSDTITGYQTWQDLSGQPALLLQVRLPRDIYGQGQTSLQYFMLSLIACGLIFGIVTLLVQERTVLARLATLTQGVGRMQAQRDLSQRLVVDGKDELAGLATTLNDLVDSVDKEQRDRQQAEAALRQQNAMQKALHDTMLGLVQRLDLDSLLEALMVRATVLLGTEHGYLYIMNEATDRLVCQIGVGVFEDFEGYQLQPGEGLGGQVRERGEMIVVDDYAAWPHHIPRFSQLRAAIGLPLWSGGKLAGVLGLGYIDSDQRFTPEMVALLENFGQLASLVLDNARLFTAAQQELVERRRVEEQLVVAKEAAEAANRAKSTFLANMSHELRTPLNAILGFTQILQLEAPMRGWPELLPDLEQIQLPARHLLRLIGDILDLSKIEADKVTVEPTVFAIEDLVDEVATISRPLVEKQGNQFVVEAGSGAIETDLPKVQQILLNLLSNAAKFTNQGTISLEVTQQQREQEPWLVCTVSDTGIGIAADQIERLFNPFTQVNESSTRQHGGTGLGLAISRRLARLLGGDLGITSEPGVGTRFTLEIPTTALAINEKLAAV